MGERGHLHGKEWGDPLEEIIQRYNSNTSPIIVNHELLRFDYVPRVLPHRTNQIRAVARGPGPVA
jgi:hypothetical protein